MYPVRLPLWFMRWLMPRKCCSECGMAWGRVVESKGGTTGKSWHDHSDDAAAGMHQTQDSIGNAANENGEKYSRTTLRWQPRCECGAEAIGPTILDCYSGPGTSAAAAEYLWTNKAEGYDTVLADAKTVATRPGKASKHHEDDGSQRPEYAKARMVKTGTPTSVYCEWLPGKALMLDLDPAVEKLYPRRRDECFNAMQDGPGMKTPEQPLFTQENK